MPEGIITKCLVFEQWFEMNLAVHIKWSKATSLNYSELVSIEQLH